MPSTPLTRLLLGLLLGLTGSVCAFAQAAAEYGSLTSKAAAAAAKAKPLALNPTPPAQPPSAHLPVQSAEAAAVANCRALKEHAGPDAAKLSLRSVPDHAQVWIDTRFVGTTPLDLTVAPGTLEVRGAGMESARQKVELPPKQTLQVTVSLKPYYRNKISLR